MLLLLLLGVLLDQVTKYLVMTHMTYLQSIPILDGVFHLTYVLNDGAAFSILEGKRWFFIVLTVVVLAVCFYFYRKMPKEQTFSRFSLVLLATGAIGNFIDRIRFGAVVDFFDFRIWPVFNVADCFVVVGVFCLAIAILWGDKIQNRSKLRDNGKD